MLESLRTQTLPSGSFEVIVIDDGSTDDTPGVLEAEQRLGELRLTWRRNDRSVGPGASRNLGWRLAKAPLIAFTDDDCEAEPQWLAAGLAAWSEREDRFVQGRTTPIGRERHRLGLKAYSYEITAPDEDYQTCNMFYPRVLLERLGGFDHASFPRAVGEDTDLGWRAREAGADCVFAPDAAVQHAVLDLSFRCAVRRAWSWGFAAPLYRRHADLRRRRLLYRVFWNWQHHSTGRAWLAVLLPRSRAMWPLKAWLAHPWLADRALDPDSRRPSLRRAAWYAVTDNVEMASMLVKSLRQRMLVL